jgi:hypothetical protein
MSDSDGDGDIDAYDEELTEYELQLMEDEMIFEEMEGWRNQGSKNEENWGKSCGYGFLIGLGFFVLVVAIASVLGS